jgi:hypothetical protein
MTKKCKPTVEAILFRIEAVERHGRIHAYKPSDPLPIWVFGLPTTKKKGELTMDDLIKELL